MSMYLYFALMVVISIAWILYFIYRPVKANDVNLEKSNVSIGKQKISELEQDLKQGLIDKSEFNSAKEEISATLAVELEEHDQEINNSSVGTLTTVSIFAFLALLSFGTYQYLAPEFDINKPPQARSAPPSLEQSAEKIKEHLKNNPNDYEAYQILGLTYFEMGKLNESTNAYEKAYQINPKDPRLLVEYASTIVTMNGNRFDTRSAKLIKEALDIEPDAPDALYLSGMFAVSVKDFSLAKTLWNKALSALEKDSPDYQAILSMLNELSQIEAVGVNNTVEVIVNIDESIISTRADDFIMVYLKSAQGRPMPIAIKKLKLNKFTGSVVLSNKDSVMSNTNLSNFDKVVAVVRISASGSAIKQDGDLQVESDIISVVDNPSVSLHLK